METHQKGHMGVKPFQCSECGVRYRDKMSCKKHIEKIHNGCGSINKNSTKLDSGIKSEPGLVLGSEVNISNEDEIDINPFKCKTCGKGFSNSRYLASHRSVHTGEKLFHCQFCDARFRLRRTLVIHVRTHTGERPYVCGVCGYKFTQHTSCKNHLRKIHGVQDGFQGLIQLQKNSNPNYLSSVPVPVAQSSASATGNANESGYLNIVETTAKYSVEDENLCQIDTARATQTPTDQTQQKQTESTKFKCRFCSKRFAKHKYKAKHEKIHAKPFGCRFCGMRFSLMARLEIHERSHTKIKVEPEIESLTTVTTSTSETGGAAAATSSPSASSPLFRCNVCNKEFSSRGGLWEHKSIHTGAKPFHCEICDAKFRLRKTLTQHMLVHTEQRPYQCEICLLQFKRRIECNDHVRKLHGVQDGSGVIIRNLQTEPLTGTGASSSNVNGNQQPLPGAQPTATAASQAQDFQTKRNAVQKKFKCRFCSKRFAMGKYRTKHEKVHAKPFGCKFCEHRFTFRSKLESHEKSHMAARRFQCGVCGASYTQRFNCNNHIQRIHNGRGDIKRISQDKRIKTEPEETMPSTFVTSIPLTTTMMTTTTENNVDTGMQAHQQSVVQQPQAPTANNENANFSSVNDTSSIPDTPEPESQFNCKFCGKCFSNSRSKTKHERTHRKPFTCTICGKGFSFRNKLTSHELSHAGIKPFQCGTCGQRFAKRTTCKDHQLKVHGITDGEILKNLLLDDNTNTTQIGESFDDFANSRSPSTSTAQASTSFLRELLETDNEGNLNFGDSIENNEAETEDVVVKPALDSYLLEVEGDAAEFNLNHDHEEDVIDIDNFFVAEASDPLGDL